MYYDESLEKAIEDVLAIVLKTFDDVDKLSAKQIDGNVNFIWRKDVLAVLPTGFGKSLLFQLIPGLCVELKKMEYHHPESPMIVICPLNALIECHMMELKKRGIPCTWLSGDDVDKDGAIAGKYTFVFANPTRLSSMKNGGRCLNP